MKNHLQYGGSTAAAAAGGPLFLYCFQRLAPLEETCGWRRLGLAEWHMPFDRMHQDNSVYLYISAETLSSVKVRIRYDVLDNHVLRFYLKSHCVSTACRRWQLLSWRKTVSRSRACTDGETFVVHCVEILAGFGKSKHRCRRFSPPSGWKKKWDQTESGSLKIDW